MPYDFATLVDRPDSVKLKLFRDKNPNVDDLAIPLSIADMEWKHAPEIIEGLKSYLDKTILGYPQPTDDYFAAVIDWMKRRHQFEVAKEWIYPVSGIVPALHAIVASLTAEGDGIMVMPPVYYPFYMAIDNAKRHVVNCPLLRHDRTYTIDFELFETLAADKNNTMFILCNPHNPVGRVWTKEELARIDAICREHNVLVLADEIHQDLMMPGYQHTVFQTVSPEAALNTVTCTAPTKTFNLAGMGISNLIIADPEKRERYDAYEERIGFPAVTLLGYKACELAYRHAEAWLDEALGHINTNRQLVEAFMAQYFPEIEVTKLEGTYLMWLNRAALPEKDGCRFYAQPGKMFGAGGETFWRVNLAAPAKVLQLQLNRLAEDYGRV